ncbi:MAG: DUF3540 domain-containing protein [Thermodesulfobacteriota bacterium]|nr:DUF3540 domain-containing protein [Thermodesulfobacteriota bacterium]
MFGVARKPAPIPGTGYFGPARVLEIDEERGLFSVLVTRCKDRKNAFKTWARLAIPYPHELHWGETVLVAGETIDDFYVIGLLDVTVNSKVQKTDLVLQNGTRAAITGTPDAEQLKVFSQDGGLIFEYDSKTGKSRVDIPEGDLELIAANGNIDFISAQDIRFFSKNSIDMKSETFGLTAQAGELHIEETHYTGKKVVGEVHTARLMVERLETLAGTIMEKAKNVYRTVEKLSQIKAGRMRTLVKETCQFKSKKAFFKAEEDFKIKGEKIHLG